WAGGAGRRRSHRLRRLAARLASRVGGPPPARRRGRPRARLPRGHDAVALVADRAVRGVLAGPRPRTGRVLVGGPGRDIRAVVASWADCRGGLVGALRGPDADRPGPVGPVGRAARRAAVQEAARVRPV